MGKVYPNVTSSSDEARKWGNLVRDYSRFRFSWEYNWQINSIKLFVRSNIIWIIGIDSYDHNEVPLVILDVKTRICNIQRSRHQAILDGK